MPNWCDNELFIYGAPEEVAQLAVLVRSSDENAFCFNKVIPIPADVNLKASEGWYAWSIKHWGTKWNVDNVVPMRSLDSVEYHFSTAWAPPIPVIKKLMEMFPDLYFRLRYVEPGVGYAGELTNESHEEGPYQENAWAHARYPSDEDGG